MRCSTFRVHHPPGPDVRATHPPQLAQGPGQVHSDRYRLPDQGLGGRKRKSTRKRRIERAEAGVDCFRSRPCQLVRRGLFPPPELKNTLGKDRNRCCLAARRGEN